MVVRDVNQASKRLAEHTRQIDSILRKMPQICSTKKNQWLEEVDKPLQNSNLCSETYNNAYHF